MKNGTGRIMPHELVHTKAWNKPKGTFILKFLRFCQYETRHAMYA